MTTNLTVGIEKQKNENIILLTNLHVVILFLQPHAFDIFE
jgi:hypothetical protein